MQLHLALSSFFFILLSASLVDGVPSESMCRSFASFASKWNPLPETLVSWTSKNCHLIEPRPADMSCEDVVQFVADCNFGSGSTSNSAIANTYYQKYVHCNRQTVYDYGHFGQWYYPNCYPWSYLGGFDGRPDSISRLENDYSMNKGGNYPYHRADNIINIGLQQTSLPTCLHDIIYCARASYTTPYQRYYQEKAAEEEEQRRREEIRARKIERLRQQQREKDRYRELLLEENRRRNRQ